MSNISVRPDGVLAWQDPPPSKPPGHDRIFSEAVLAQLRQHPAQWALIRAWPYKKSVINIKPPPCDIETCMVRVTRGSELYARATPRATTNGAKNGTH